MVRQFSGCGLLSDVCDRLHGRRTDARPEYPDGSARLCACPSWAALHRERWRRASTHHRWHLQYDTQPLLSVICSQSTRRVMPDSGSHYLDDVAYWAHTTDLRPCSGTTDGTIAGLSVTGHCIAGTQSLTVYSFFAFGNINGRGILAQAARLGGFEDSNNDGIPQTNEWDKENNLTGAATPDGIPDAYFESSNVTIFRTSCSPRSQAFSGEVRPVHLYPCWPLPRPAKGPCTNPIFIPARSNPRR
jgi:hypothetical protein